ncbi:SRPBCC domain-containing protein [Chryseobacterium indologenes]|uniref:SRPBCC family protein n=1 Tax=Chryseobacterium TaxID=59732 RepID=UPI0003E080CA|nr:MULTISPECIES: SRPBCC domain-containing protein [Chryseobacterium]ATN04536.1 SRPBCC domain-containing protein [Chryseobacterium indologenes]AYY86713.1 SRPBCC domain-containing protein [Chryseobacterium indologenes]QIX83616.1 SRPBCC domain-containing protein [Chryseobacterium indologenes]TLX25034.1 SRPBCC domain-containing protein [Chryseobacterium indologenes]UDQ53321.1 SRPBCC domain-containing protein [Chryseobacterium indologenes]
MNDYTNTIEVSTTPHRVYEALTHSIPLWWSALFTGSSSAIGDVFTIRFGDHIHKTFKVEEMIPDSKVAWYVEDSLIALPELKNQTEWIGTTVVWEIVKKENNALIKVTHIGLRPAVECYEICSTGWVQFLGSLKQFLETGKGSPYEK